MIVLLILIVARKTWRNCAKFLDFTALAEAYRLLATHPCVAINPTIYVAGLI